jgi:hypothetical protein
MLVFKKILRVIVGIFKLLLFIVWLYIQMALILLFMITPGVAFFLVSHYFNQDVLGIFGGFLVIIIVAILRLPYKFMRLVGEVWPKKFKIF